MKRNFIFLLGVAAVLVIADMEKSDYDHETKTYKSSFKPVSVSTMVFLYYSAKWWKQVQPLMNEWL